MDRFDESIDQLLEQPYHVIDILPDQVKDCRGQFFAAEDYFRTPERLRPIRSKFANVILKLNCYYDLEVCFYSGAGEDPEDGCEKNPDPSKLADSIISMPDNCMARVLIESGSDADVDEGATTGCVQAMIDVDGCDIYMTLYGGDDELLGRVEALAKAEGLFVR